MRHASLFSGIGGPEVAAAMLGWENVFHCEINEFGRKVLDYWFPESDSYEDITKTDFTKYRGTIDVLTGGFPCQPFSYAGKRGGKQMTAISGRKCSALLAKSGPLGSLVKMLLESQQWWSNAGLLKWEAKPLCSKRIMEFTDIMQNTPSPLNESALILNQWDIQSSRCLFRLVLSVRHIEGIESSSLPIMLQTPQTREVCETPEQMKQRKQRNGYQNGTKYNGLMSQLMHDPKCSHLLPTPNACDYNTTWSEEAKAECLRRRAEEGKEAYPSKFNSLRQLARENLLPTPTCNDATNQTLPKSQAERNDSLVKRILKGELGVSISKKDGHHFRLSPLFTEEMMGFPLMWTTWPFLLGNGELNQ